FSVFWADLALARVFFYRTAPSGSHRLPPPHAVHLRVLGRPDLAAELLDLGQRLGGPLEEAVGLGERLVFDAHPRHAALLQLADQPSLDVRCIFTMRKSTTDEKVSHGIGIFLGIAVSRTSART